MSKTHKLIYLHGFNSSPQSHKALLVKQYMLEKHCADALLCPQIPVIPDEARVFLEQLVEEALKDYSVSFVGSSLGGYYATYLAEKYSAKAVLVNPSVKPYETLAAYLGENTFYFEDGSWDFNESHIQQLKAMDVEKISVPNRYLVLLQTGDETLDYRQAELKYKKARCIIEQGGDHGFTGFERYIPQLIQFSQIQCD